MNWFLSLFIYSNDFKKLFATNSFTSLETVPLPGRFDFKRLMVIIFGVLTTRYVRNWLRCHFRKVPRQTRTLHRFYFTDLVFNVYHFVVQLSGELLTDGALRSLFSYEHILSNMTLYLTEPLVWMMWVSLWHPNAR